MTTVRVRFTPNGTPTPGQISFVLRHDEGNRPIASGRDILNGPGEWVPVPVEGADVEVRPNDPGTHYVVKVRAGNDPQQTETFTIPPNGPINFGDLVRYDPKAGMAYEPDPDWYAHLNAIENGIGAAQADVNAAVTEAQSIAANTANSIRGEVSADADRAENSANQATTIKGDLEQIFLGGTPAVNDAAVSTFASTRDSATHKAIGMSAWKPDAPGAYRPGQRVIMPNGDVQVANTWAQPSSAPRMSEWDNPPQVQKGRRRLRSEAERTHPDTIRDVEIPEAFLNVWNPGIKILESAGRYSTPWRASSERNTGSDVLYFGKEGSNSNSGHRLGATTSGHPAGNTLSSISVSSTSELVVAGSKIVVEYQGLVIDTPSLVVASNTSAGATSIPIQPVTVPEAIPVGSGVISPWNTIDNTLNNVQSGGTIYALDEVVFRQQAFQSAVTKSVNLDTLRERTLYVCSDDVSWSAVSGSGGSAYTANRSNVRTVVDMAAGGDGYEYQRLASAEDVIGNPGTWHQASGSGVITVAPLSGQTPDNTSLFCLLTTHMFSVTAGSTDMRVHLRNISLIGGMSGVPVDAPGDGQLTFVRENTHILWGGYGPHTATSGTVSDGLRVRGNVISLAENSTVSCCVRDGANYGGGSRNLEIDCGGHTCGSTRLAYELGMNDTQNVSTTHDGSPVLRIGGAYRGAHGTNVADVHENTKSLNYGCDSYKSKVTDSNYNAAFGTQQTGAEMWLIGCRAWGCTYDIHASAGTTVHVWDTEFDTSRGIQFMDIVNPL